MLGLILTIAVLGYNIYLGYTYFIAKDMEEKWYLVFLFLPSVVLLALYYILKKLKGNENETVAAESQS